MSSGRVLRAQARREIKALVEKYKKLGVKEEEIVERLDRAASQMPDDERDGPIPGKTEAGDRLAAALEGVLVKYADDMDDDDVQDIIDGIAGPMFSKINDLDG